MLQVLMELTQPALSPEQPDRIGQLVTCHQDPYNAAQEGESWLRVNLPQF